MVGTWETFSSVFKSNVDDMDGLNGRICCLSLTNGSRVALLDDKGRLGGELDEFTNGSFNLDSNPLPLTACLWLWLWLWLWLLLAVVNERVGDDGRDFTSGLIGETDFERVGSMDDFGEAQGLLPPVSSFLPLRDSILLNVAAVNFRVGD